MYKAVLYEKLISGDPQQIVLSFTYMGTLPTANPAYTPFVTCVAEYKSSKFDFLLPSRPLPIRCCSCQNHASTSSYPESVFFKVAQILSPPLFQHLPIISPNTFSKMSSLDNALIYTFSVHPIFAKPQCVVHHILATSGVGAFVLFCIVCIQHFHSVAPSAFNESPQYL